MYLVVRGTATAQRYQGHNPLPLDDTEQHLAYTPSSTSASGIRHPASGIRHPASGIHRARELLDHGIISQGEFEALKDKALGRKL